MRRCFEDLTQREREISIKNMSVFTRLSMHSNWIIYYWLQTITKAASDKSCREMKDKECFWINSGSLLMEMGKMFSLDCNSVHFLKVGQNFNFLMHLMFLNKSPLKGLKASDKCDGCNGWSAPLGCLSFQGLTQGMKVSERCLFLSGSPADHRKKQAETDNVQKIWIWSTNTQTSPPT